MSCLENSTTQKCVRSSADGRLVYPLVPMLGSKPGAVVPACQQVATRTWVARGGAVLQRLSALAATDQLSRRDFHTVAALTSAFTVLSAVRVPPRAIAAESSNGSESQEDLKPFPTGPAAVLFDLDGTLTETELLKARAYGLVAQRLIGCPGEGDKLPSPSPQAAPKDQFCDMDYYVTAYMQSGGATSKQVAKNLVEVLNLAPALAPDQARLGTSTAWETLYKLYKEAYFQHFATDENIRAAAYPETLTLLRRAAASGLPVAVVTSSTAPEAEASLRALGVWHLLRFVIGKDQVKESKPNPEGYLAATARLGVPPARTLVFEDSIAGITAASAAGCHVLPVANRFTEPALRTQKVVPQERVIYDLGKYEDILLRECSKMQPTEQQQSPAKSAPGGGMRAALARIFLRRQPAQA